MILHKKNQRVITTVQAASTKKKIKAWAVVAAKYLFFAFFLGLLAAILYAAELLRR